MPVMADAIPTGAGAAQLLAARLFAQATAQGQAILAASAAGATLPEGARRQTPPLPGNHASVPSTAPPALPPSTTAPAGTAPTPSGPAPVATPVSGAPDPAPRLPATQPGADPAATAPARPPAAQVVLSPAAQPLSPSPPPREAVAPALVQALTTARAEAVTRQASAAPLLADLPEAVQRMSLPAPVQAAARQVLAQQTSMADLTRAAPVKDAVRASGVFLEARVAAAGPLPQASAPPDMKAALLILAARLREWAPADRASKGPNVQGGEDMQTSPASVRDGLPPPPPVKGRPAPAQPPASPSLPMGAEPPEVRELLLHRTEAALARQVLMQAASSRVARAAHEDGPATATATAQSWMFEIPVATPHGPAMLPFQIDRDGGSGAAGGGPSPITWKVAFALDIEPAGPVHVRAALTRAEAAVTILAERPKVAATLAGRAADLADALGAAGFNARVAIGGGAPEPSPMEPGYFVDRAT